MKRTELRQEIRVMRFEEVFSIWTEKRVTQEEAAQILGICGRTEVSYIANCTLTVRLAMVYVLLKCLPWKAEA